MPTWVCKEGGTIGNTTDKEDKCDLCNSTGLFVLIDGKTRMGPWANMCQLCHDLYGVGLGTGYGQLYIRKV